MNGDHECPNRNWQGSLENSHTSALKTEGEHTYCLDCETPIVSVASRNRRLAHITVLENGLRKLATFQGVKSGIEQYSNGL